MHYCGVCKKVGERNKLIVEHHRSYRPEVIVLVCQSCHKLIHRLAKYPDRQLIRMVKEAVAYRPNTEDGANFGRWTYDDELRKTGKKRLRPSKVSLTKVDQILEPKYMS